MKADMKVIFYKAGKADAIFIKSDGHSAMIDSGLEKNAGALLRKMHARRLDALVLTHYDKDHIGGTPSILKHMHVGQVFLTHPGSKLAEYMDIRKCCHRKKIEPCIVENDVSFQMGEAFFEVFAAKRFHASFPSNNSSLVVRVTCRGKRFLFMGDAQSERIREFMAAHDVSCDVLKVPYHGRIQEGLGSLAEHSQASHAVITNGDNDPDPIEIGQAVALLKANGMLVHETRRSDVVAIVKEGVITVKH